MGLSGIYNDPVPEEFFISIIKYAFTKGITFFDTADVYGANANEVLVGKVNKPAKDILQGYSYLIVLAATQIPFPIY